MKAWSPWRRRLCFAMPFLMRALLCVLRYSPYGGGHPDSFFHCIMQVMFSSICSSMEYSCNDIVMSTQTSTETNHYWQITSLNQYTHIDFDLTSNLYILIKYEIIQLLTEPVIYESAYKKAKFV